MYRLAFQSIPKFLLLNNPQRSNDSRELLGPRAHWPKVSLSKLYHGRMFIRVDGLITFDSILTERIRRQSRSDAMDTAIFLNQVHAEVLSAYARKNNIGEGLAEIVRGE
jgi:hypothetical protein